MYTAFHALHIARPTIALHNALDVALICMQQHTSERTHGCAVLSAFLLYKLKEIVKAPKEKSLERGLDSATLCFACVSVRFRYDNKGRGLLRKMGKRGNFHQKFTIFGSKLKKIWE